MMPISPHVMLIATINVSAVLILLYWGRFLVKRVKENTEFADLLLQHRRIEDDVKPLGRYKGLDEVDVSTIQGTNPVREASYARRPKSSSRVLRNLDVWKWAKSKESRKETMQEQVEHDVPPADQESSGGVRQRRPINCSRT